MLLFLLELLVTFYLLVAVVLALLFIFRGYTVTSTITINGEEVKTKITGIKKFGYLFLLCLAWPVGLEVS